MESVLDLDVIHTAQLIQFIASEGLKDLQRKYSFVSHLFHKARG